MYKERGFKIPNLFRKLQGKVLHFPPLVNRPGAILGGWAWFLSSRPLTVVGCQGKGSETLPRLEGIDL
jgi:hypothetical protein